MNPKFYFRIIEYYFMLHPFPIIEFILNVTFVIIELILNFRVYLLLFYLLQLASSDLSEQSNLLSHFFLASIHCPFLHLN